jgi:hypothetical protein
MEVMAGFIVGFDNDPTDIFQLQIEFIRASAIPQAMVGILTALPDTQLWRRLEREGRLLADSSGNNTDGSLNFMPRMDAAKLVEGYKQILKTIYSPDEYYQRARACLSRVTQDSPEPQGGNWFLNLISLGRTLCTLGVFDRERGQFWKFLSCILVRQPRRLPEAVVLASLGYHYRKITEDLLRAPADRNALPVAREAAAMRAA